MDRESAMQALKDLLAELPAEFSWSVPGAREPRYSFKVIKKRNVLKVHQSLWDIQCHFGLQSERGHNLELLESTPIDDETKALSNVYARGRDESMETVKVLLGLVDSGRMSPEDFVHTLRGYLG